MKKYNDNNNSNIENNNSIKKLTKIAVQSHHPKTYICSNSDNAKQEV